MLELENSDVYECKLINSSGVKSLAYIQWILNKIVLEIAIIAALGIHVNDLLGDLSDGITKTNSEA